MESHAPLDPSGCAAVGRLNFAVLLVLSLFFLPAAAFPQSGSPGEERVSRIKQMYDARRWSDVVRAVPEPDNEDADLQMYRALSLAKLERWDEARQTL